MKIGTIILFAALFSASFSSHAYSDELQFEGAAKNPIPFESFELSEPDGKPVPADRKATLRLSGDVAAALKVETADVKSSFTKMGYDVVDRANGRILEPIEATAKEYLAEFDKAELSLNSLGHTLRNTAKITEREIQKLDYETITAQVVEAAEIYSSEVEAEYIARKKEAEQTLDDLKANIQEYKAMVESTSREDLYLHGQDGICAYTDDKGNSVAADDAKCFVEGFGGGDTQRNPLLAPEPSTCAADTPLGKTVLSHKNWSDGGGDKRFGWDAFANYQLKSDAQGISLNSDAKAGIKVLGKEYPVLEIHGDFVSPRKGKPSSTRWIKILGKTQTKKDESWDLTLISSKDEKGNETLIQYKDENIASHTFVVGFVPIVVKVDTRIAVGPRYSLDLAPVTLKGRFEYVNQLSMLASAGVGADLKFFLILAGIRGSIDLVNTTTGVYPEVSFYLNEKNRPLIGARLTGLSELITMQGQIDLGVWAKTTFSVPVPKKSFPFLEFKPLSYEWTQTIGKYPGYKFPSAVLFDEKIGYDICSGRKEVNVLVASQPRHREDRQSLADLEGNRVTSLENDFLAVYDKTLDENLEKVVLEAIALSEAGMHATIRQANALLLNQLGTAI